MTSSHFLSIIIVLMFISYTFTQETHTVIEIGTKKTQVTSSNKDYLKFSLPEEEIQVDKYLRIFTNPHYYNNPANFYISQKEEYPSSSKREFFSLKSNNNLYYIPINKIDQTQKTIYIGVTCEINCDYSIIVEIVDEMALQLDKDENENKEITINLFTNKTVLYYTPDNESTRTVVISSYGESYLMFKMIIQDSEGNSIENKHFYNNGYASLIDLTAHSKGKYSIMILTEGEDANSDKKVTVSIQYADNTEKTPNTIYLLDKVYGYIDNSKVNKICYTIEETTGTEQNFYLNIETYTQSILYTEQYTSTSTIINQEIIYFNNYEIIPSQELYLKLSMICFSPLEGSTLPVSFSFQLISDEHIKTMQKYLMPLSNGIQYIKYLPKDQVIYYRHGTYPTHAVSLTSHLLPLQGKPVLYGYTCQTFPDCDFTNEKLEKYIIEKKVNQARDINGEYMLKTYEIKKELFLDNKVQYITIVKCLKEKEDDKDCKFVIDINNNLDNVEMLPDLEYSNSIETEGVHFYMFRIYDLSKIKKISFFMTSITGNIELNVYSDQQRTQKIDYQSTYKFAGSKQIFEITTIQYKYYLTVTTKETGFYKLLYTLNKPNVIPLTNGIENIEHISKNDHTKTFLFTNTKHESDYVISVLALNCVPIVTFNGTEYSTSKNVEITINKKDPIYNDENYYLSVSVKDFETNSSNNDEYCTVKITGTDNNIVLTEGNYFMGTLTSRIKTQTFIYPFIHVGISESINLLFEYNIETKIRIDVHINTVEQKVFMSYDLYKSGSFIITDQLSSRCTKNELCKLILIVSKESDIDVPFRLLVQDNEYLPGYLEKNELRADRVFPSEMQYYYSDIAKDEEGEIIVNFKKGNGNVYAKIVKKSDIENNANWSHRVVLPAPGQTGDNILIFDSFTKKLVYTKKQTAECDNGCEIYLAVSSEEMFYYNQRPTEFTIYINKNKSITKIQFDEYINGNIEDINTFMYYKLEVPLDIAKLLIILTSPLSELYVNCNSEVSETNYKWKLEGNKNLLVSAEKCEASTFKSMTLNIMIKLKEKNNLTSYFMFKITPQYKITINKPIIKASSEQAEQCNIEPDNDYCIFLIDISDTERKNKLFAYAYNRDNRASVFSFYVNEYKTNEITSNYYTNDITSLIPTPEKSGFAFKDTNQMELNFNVSDNMFILVTVYSKTKANINFITAYYVGAEMTNLLVHTEQLLYITKEEKLKVNIINNNAYNNRSYMIETSVVKGNALASLNGYEKPIDGSYIPNIEDKPDQEDLILKSRDSDKETVILINYFFREILNNFFEMKNDKINTVDLLNHFFPITVYFPVETNDINNIVNVHFDDIDFEKFVSKKDYFDIKGYIVDEAFINRRKLEPKLKPNSTEISSTYYADERVGYLSVKNNQNINNSNIISKYLLITVDVSPKNKNSYSKITTSFLCYHVANPAYSIPQMKYIYGSVEVGNKVIYKLNKYDKTEQIFEIEFSFNPYNNTKNESEWLDFAIEPFSETPKFKNDSSLYFQTTGGNGKRVMIVESENFNSILFTVIPTTTNMDFIVKYKTVTSKEKLIKFVYSPSIHWLYDPELGKINLTFTKIKDEKGEYQEPLYVLKIFRSNDVKNNSNFIHSIFPFNDNFNTKYEDDLISKSDQETNISRSIALEDYKQKYYISLVASFDYNEYEEIKLGYEIATIELDFSDNNLLWIIIIVCILVIGLLLGGFFFYRHYKKTKDKERPRISENNKPLLVDDLKINDNGP